ncbi:unnamed protein product [Dicrocoelium dendriticum]|nr:unnamed protein product [Dicrocoelium dendriticum]
MDGLLAKLEISAAVLLTACDAQARRQAEAQIIQLREQPRPYDLCCFILNKTSNEYLIYEAGRCLSRAVVKEWNELFAPSFDQGEACKAKQLLSFVLSWAELRGSQISAAPRQRVLGAAGALAKRAAAAFAEQVAAAWRSTSTDTPVSMTPSQRRWTRHRVLTNPPDDPGPPCDLMLRLVEHIENLVRPLLECGVEDPLPKQDSACQKCLLGLCVMSALLDEVSNAEDSVHFEMVLEAHIFLRARFQDFELVRLFHLLLCVIDWVIRRWSNAQLTSSQLEQNELIFRLVSCLDCIGSWDFLPRELVGFYTSRLRRANREMCFRPSLKWSPIFGPEAMSNTLLLLIKLHTLVRQSDMLGTRTLSFLTRLTAMTGPLTEPVTPLSVPSDDPGSSGASSMDGHGPVSSTACRLHILTCMDYLTYWLDDGADEVSNTSAVLRAFPPDHQRIVNEECQKRLVDPACVPRLALHQLMPYELPIFSELMQDIVIRSPRAWEPVATCLSLPSSSAAEWDSACDTQSVYQHAMLSLVVIDRFFVRMCTLIIQCLKFLATASLSVDGDGQPAHEAIERLFNNWIDLFESIPSSGSDLAAGDSADLVFEPGSHEFTYPGTDNLPLPLTTGNLDELDNRTHEIKKLLHILTVNVSRHRIRLFQFYLLSKLGPSVGLRPAGQPEEHIDLDLDEDDLIAYEDSLFACGSCGVAAPDYSIKLLLQLVDERIAQLIRTHGEPVSQATLDLYEDLHWILLVTGHFLVPGPSSLSKVVRSVFDWYTEFSIPHQLVVVNNEASVDCVMSCRLLHLAASGQFSAFSEAWPPPKVQLDNVPLFLRLIASLYRLLWLQAGSGLGSAQLIQDNLWLLARFAVAYLCHLSFDRELSSPPLRDSSILAILNENLSVLKKASGGTTYGGDLFSQDGDKENETVLFTETRTVCIRGLLTCAGLTLNKWLYEPQVLSKAAGLIQVVGRYSLLASKILRYPAWYELCSVLFNVEESTRIWPNITTDSLMALTESCLCGSYAVDEDTLCIPPSRRPSDGNTEPLFFQLLHGLREHQHRVLAQFTQSRSTVNSLAADDLVRCLASLRGLARAIGWLSAHGKTQSDLISLAWTSALYPALESGAQVLMLQCHNSSEIVQAVFSLFSEVADSCLIYLANVPLGPQLVHTSTAVDTHKVLGSTASASFLSVTMRLCQQYVKQNLSEYSLIPI